MIKNACLRPLCNVPTKMDENARALAKTLNHLASFESDEIQLYEFSTLQVGISAENSSSSEDERKEPQNAHSDDEFFQSSQEFYCTCNVLCDLECLDKTRQNFE